MQILALFSPIYCKKAAKNMLFPPQKFTVSTASFVTMFFSAVNKALKVINIEICGLSLLGNSGDFREAFYASLFGCPPGCFSPLNYIVHLKSYTEMKLR